MFEHEISVFSPSDKDYACTDTTSRFIKGPLGRECYSKCPIIITSIVPVIRIDSIVETGFNVHFSEMSGVAPNSFKIACRSTSPTSEFILPVISLIIENSDPVAIIPIYTIGIIRIGTGIRRHYGHFHYSSEMRFFRLRQHFLINTA